MREIESRTNWNALLNEQSESAVAVQAQDCRSDTAAIVARSWADSLFLGCRLEPEAMTHIVSSGGVVIPHLSEFEFPVHRASLYRVEDLYAGFDSDDPDSYAKTPDARIYQQYCEQGKERPTGIHVSLARRLHDHSMSDALAEALEGQPVAAVMGGHRLERGNPLYAKAALLSRRLAREGFLMITGGGPGAMEACHLGVYLADHDDDAMQQALEMLAPRPAGAVPGKEYADKDWLQRAWRVREQFPESTNHNSIGIPTWMYGHEPPAAFASQHAKYFANSVREDGLLMWATHGIVFTPGSAGTLQEVFQDCCQNHYEVTGHPSPMILFGSDHWTHTVPAWSLLQVVSKNRNYADWLRLTDDVEEVVSTLSEFRKSMHVD